MKNTLAKCLIGSALAVAALAAQAETYIDTGAPNPDGVASSSGVAELKLSKSTLTALNTASAWAFPTDGAYDRTGFINERGLVSVIADYPWQSTVLSLPGNFQSLQFGGTLRITTDEDGLAVNPGGGALNISNLRVDLPAGIVYADVTSGFELGTAPQNIAMWTFGAVNQAVTGDSSVSFPQLSLMLTDAGAEALIQGLNLTSNIGVPAIKRAQNNGAFATLDVSLRMGSPLQAIPEASTYSMMLLGLAGVSGVAAIKRRRAATPPIEHCA
jgi:hypothetical protein